jgi:3-oxoacyl-[acyl-carrier-protein] synthase III
MGAIIDAAATSHRSMVRGNVIDRAVAVCRNAVEQAGHSPDEIGVLVNCSVYPNRFVVEPATSAFIQHGLGANESGSSQLGDSSTFSFDLNHGGCGFLTAISVVDGFLSDGSTQLGMVVGSDPAQTEVSASNYPFGGGAAAVVLRQGNRGEGFVGFQFEDGPAQPELFESFAIPQAGCNRAVPEAADSGYGLMIDERPEFASECADLVVKAIPGFLQRMGASHVDLVIASEYPAELGSMLRHQLGFGPDVFVQKQAPHAPLHTASLGASLELAIRNGQFERAQRILFVAAGAGPAVALAFYENGP